MTGEDWRAEHNAFLATVQHRDIADLYIAALYEDDQPARQKLTTIVEVAWDPSHTRTSREPEAARAIRLLIVHDDIRQQKKKAGHRGADE